MVVASGDALLPVAVDLDVVPVKVEVLDRLPDGEHRSGLSRGPEEVASLRLETQQRLDQAGAPRGVDHGDAGLLPAGEVRSRAVTGLDDDVHLGVLRRFFQPPGSGRMGTLVGQDEVATAVGWHEVRPPRPQDTDPGASRRTLCPRAPGALAVDDDIDDELPLGRHGTDGVIAQDRPFGTVEIELTGVRMGKGEFHVIPDRQRQVGHGGRPRIEGDADAAQARTQLLDRRDGTVSSVQLVTNPFAHHSPLLGKPYLNHTGLGPSKSAVHSVLVPPSSGLLRWPDAVPGPDPPHGQRCVLMRLLLAPDSFKGSVPARTAAHVLRTGWRDVRPDDEVQVLPMADGGEGTLDAVEAATAGVQRIRVPVDGPGGVTEAPWLLLPDGTGVVELAACCGLPLWPEPDPVGAHTRALGQVLREAATHPEVRRLVVAVGGSASTDGGSGALAALGARFTLDNGGGMPWGAAQLPLLAHVDVTDLVSPPSGGVRILTDVTAPLVGSRGAATQFAPQKGASSDQVSHLERGLSRLASLLGGHPQAAGSGAAGGTAYGLAATWGAQLVPGSAEVADIVGLDAALAEADVVVTGEGRLDAQSFRGKVIGEVSRRALTHGVPVFACVGSADPDVRERVAQCLELTDLAGSRDAAMADPQRWLREAGRVLAQRFG